MSLSDAALNEAKSAFVEESRDLLQSMEVALLALENNPEDTESINALFRAAHTIKGSAGLFSLNEIVHFTHVLENVLDNLRSNKLALNNSLISTLLRSADHLGILLNQVDQTGSDEGIDSAAIAEQKEITQQLHACLGSQATVHSDATSNPAASDESEEIAGSATDCWHISLRFGKDALRNGMDPLSFISYLSTIGEIEHVVTVTHHLPELKNFESESCYLGFEIQFKSAANKKTIADVFEFVREDCRIHILPPDSRVADYVKLIETLDEGSERLGDILVQCGALTKEELAEGLATQNQTKPSPKLGEILVGAQSVQREIVDAALNKQQKIQANRAEENRYIRVHAEKLDRLITLVGELVIAGAGAQLQAQRSGDNTQLEASGFVSRLTEQIRDEALRLRMVQIGETFNRFHRVVRDVSRELGKDIILEISGAETELDKSVVEKINDPLTHLIRNSMDHGIESVEERTAAGKPAKGRIQLNAYHDSGSIVIEVSDDGRGLNRERILAKARERGVISPEYTPSDSEIDNLIFMPGFSTAEQVTNLSGRGVGMDVVRRNIEELRGSVSLESHNGKGMMATIRLPLTLAIIDGFLVQIANSSYVIPLDMVVECVELPADRPKTGDYLNLRGQVLPYLHLRELFEFSDDNQGRENVIVVQFGGKKAGIVVDKLMGEAQIVIKPLGKLFTSLQGISGSSILASGEVALILDIPLLIKQAADKAHHAEISNPKNPRKKKAGAKVTTVEQV